MNIPILIAEIAKNHRGDVRVARSLIDSAIGAGANVIKMQCYDIEEMNQNHPNYERYKEAWLSMEDLHRLCQYTEECGAQFWCSAFNKSVLKDLSDFTSVLKVPSTYANNVKFIEECQRHFQEIHTSFGMSNTVSLFSKYQIPYYCVSQYPAVYPGLGAIHRLRSHYDQFGYSDHCIGIEAMFYAWIMGATFIEKHFNFSGHEREWEANEFQLAKFIDVVKHCMDNYIGRESWDSEEAYNFFSKEFPKEFEH